MQRVTLSKSYAVKTISVHNVGKYQSMSHGWCNVKTVGLELMVIDNVDKASKTLSTKRIKKCDRPTILYIRVIQDYKKG